MKKNFKVLAVFTLVFLVSLSLSAKALYPDTLSQKTIIIESDRDFPPYEFINDDGVPDGFNVDLIKALMKEVGLHYQLNLDNWTDVMKHLEEKKIDMVGGLMYTHDRSNFAKFGIPHSYISQVLVARLGSSIKKLSDLQGKNIIIQDQDRAADILFELEMDYDSIIYTNSTEQGLDLLEKGIGDVVISSDFLASYLIDKKRLKNLEIVKSISLDPQKYSFAVNTDNDELLYRLNAGLHQLKISGEYDRIYDKWFSIYEEKDFSNTIWIIVSIVVILAGIAFSIIMFLRHRIKKATASLQKTTEALQSENKQRTASEEKLQRTLRQLGLAISAGNISAWHYDIEKCVFKSIYGQNTFLNNYTYTELIKIIHPDDRNEYEKIFGRILCGENETATINYRLLIEKPNTYRYFEDKIMCIKNIYGSPINIIGTHKDVTAQIRIQKRLTDYKTKIEFITASTQIIPWEYDVKKQILYSFTENSLTPNYHFTNEDIITAIHPDYKENLKEYLRSLNMGVNERMTIEYSIKKKNQKDYTYEVSIAIPFEMDEHGKIIRYAGITRDNTSWHTMNSNLMDLKEKADRSNQLKSAFLANMSHEIRTPLNAIVGFSELIKQAETEDEKEEYSHIISVNSELLLQLINDILDLSKIEAGYVDMNDTVFDMSKLVDELVMSLSQRVKDGVALISEKPKKNFLIKMDKNRMAQIITNYVTNAAKFTTSGHIKIGYTFDQKGIRVYVEDTGIGINKDKLGKVFDRFEKLNTFAQGTGLGLSIVKSIAETRGGSVGVSSQENIGSTFWAFIPCELSDEKQTDIVFAPNMNIKTQVRYMDTDNKKNILVAEDNDSNFLLISTILKKEYNIIRANDGKEASDIVLNPDSKIDLVLMDLMMPVMDGLTSTRLIRLSNTEIPILALTAHAFDADKETALNAGCNDFIVKPVNIAGLKEKLLKYL